MLRIFHRSDVDEKPDILSESLSLKINSSYLHHRRIGWAFLTVGIFVFLGKLAGAAKEMAIAWRYGVSEKVDAYVFVFNLVNLPVAIWFGVLCVVLIPLAAQLKAEDPGEVPRFRAELLGVTILLGLLLCVAGYWGVSALFESGLAGLEGKALEEALSMVGPLALLMPMGLLVSLFSAWMMAAGRHRNTLLEAVPSLTILCVLLLPPGWVPEPLIWGTVLGFALHMASLVWPLSRHGELQAPQFRFVSPAWNWFWRSMGIMAVGQILMSFTGVIDQFFAARLDAGSIATLSYANRVMALVLGLGATAISRATLPVFSELMAQNDSSGLTGVAMRWVGFMSGLGVLVGLVCWVFAPWVIEVLFQRGAFTEQNTHEVSSILRILILQTPIYYGALVLVSLMSSKKAYVVLLWTGVIGLSVKVVSSWMLIGFMGIHGLALSNSVIYFSTSLYMIWVVINDRQ